jgi:hypothetical protein
MVACYRVQYRKKKWYFPFYTWSITVSAVNAWRLRQKVTGKKEPYLTFLRELVVALWTFHGTPPEHRRSTPELPVTLKDALRYTHKQIHISLLAIFILHYCTGLLFFGCHVPLYVLMSQVVGGGGGEQKTRIQKCFKQHPNDAG